MSLLIVKTECLFSPLFIFFSHPSSETSALQYACPSPRSSLLVQRWVSQWKHSVLSRIPSLAPLILSSTSALSLHLLLPLLLLHSRSAQLWCEILSDTLRSLASAEIKPASLSETERLTLSGRSVAVTKQTSWTQMIHCVAFFRLMEQNISKFLIWRVKRQRCWENFFAVKRGFLRVKVLQKAGFNMRQVSGKWKREKARGVGGVWPLAFLLISSSYFHSFGSSPPHFSLSHSHTCPPCTMFPDFVYFLQCKTLPGCWRWKLYKINYNYLSAGQPLRVAAWHWNPMPSGLLQHKQEPSWTNKVD